MPAEGFCAACVCAVVEAFIPAFAAADLQVTEESVDAFATDASRLVVACSTTYLAPMVSAGVNITALQGLSDCTFTGKQQLLPASNKRDLG